MAVTGGVGAKIQFKLKLSDFVDILVATPGRLLQLLAKSMSFSILYSPVIISTIIQITYL